MKNLLFVFGTRPEAIKLSPLILAAKKDSRFRVTVCSTGQHREMLHPILSFFGIIPDVDLNLMKPGQSLSELSAGVLAGVSEIITSKKIDIVLVQGDTTSCFIGGLAAFYHKIPVAHIEAGLRSGDISSPFPEEFFRRATSLYTAIHFAPTLESKNNLLKEGIPEKDVHVTGNTGIDSLLLVTKELHDNKALRHKMEDRFGFLNPTKKLVLATLHRRESFGSKMESVMKGLVKLAQRSDLEILFPLHLNPQVRASAAEIFKDRAQWIAENQRSNIWLSEPIDYVPFTYLMNRAHLIITDSGGIQEEAPSLGKPVLVARENTERPEAIVAGSSRLMPLDENLIPAEVSSIIDSEKIYNSMAQAKSAYGDGNASQRILDRLPYL